LSSEGRRVEPPELIPGGIQIRDKHAGLYVIGADMW